MLDDAVDSRVRKVKKSTQAVKLLKSMKDTISTFQEQAERIIYIDIPNQIKALDKIQQLDYFTKEYEENLQKRFRELQDTTKPFIDETVKTSQLIQLPTEQFLAVEAAMQKEVQILQEMVSKVRRSVETLQWKKRTSLQEEVQKSVIQQLEVTQTNLSQVNSLFLSYHEGRADIIYNIQKYECMDYFILLPILEVKLCRSLRNFIGDFRVHLLMLYELLTANFDAISDNTVKNEQQRDTYNMM